MVCKLVSWRFDYMTILTCSFRKRLMDSSLEKLRVRRGMGIMAFAAIHPGGVYI